MTNLENSREDQVEELPEDFDRALTSAADVESAGRSCVVIIALAVVILGLLAVWVLYTT